MTVVDDGYHEDEAFALEMWSLPGESGAANDQFLHNRHQPRRPNLHRDHSRPRTRALRALWRNGPARRCQRADYRDIPATARLSDAGTSSRKTQVSWTHPERTRQIDWQCGCRVIPFGNGHPNPIAGDGPAAAA